uniref:Uncharacterized protein n=1 Tax=Oryza barthii TaxID=65489 RepID=A0A0D3FK08_9ORYZ
MPCSAAPSSDACPGPDTAVRRRMSSTASLSLSLLSAGAAELELELNGERLTIGSGEGRRSARRCRLEVGCWRRPQRGGVGRWAQEANASSLREDGVGTEFSKARSRSGGA